MPVSILHVSDLHRDAANPIRNDVLLDSLENDRQRYCADGVRSPDLIVVSGDLIHGVRADAPEPEAHLHAQYQEAAEFLAALAERFLGGDRGRVILVPGNHDVSAYHFEQSLRRIELVPDRKKTLVAQLFSPGSPLRWSWPRFELYEIADRPMYDRRLAAFTAFYCAFYEGARTYALDAAEQIDLFDYPAFDVSIAALSSCHNNDLFNRQGAIHPGCIAEAGNKLRQPRYATRLRLAVWHHNAEGAPAHPDYMDPDLIQNLIDRGFSLGFHGHQHRPQLIDTRFRHGADRKITVISAGTLCGGPSHRHGRAYNVIELDIPARSGRLHVREMQNDNLVLPIWGRRTLPPNAAPYYAFTFDPAPEPVVQGNANTAALIEAQRLYESKQYRDAVQLLARVAAADALAGPLLLECLVKLKDRPALLDAFDPPASEAEAIHVMDALWHEGRRDRLGTLLDEPMVAESADPSVVEMRSKYKARLKA